MTDPTRPIGMPSGLPPWQAAPPVPPAAGGQYGGGAPPWTNDPGGGHATRRRSWFARHKVLTVVGAVLGIFFVLGGIGAAVGDGSTDKRPVAAAAETRASAVPGTAEATTVAPTTAAPTTASSAPTGKAPAATGVAVPKVVGRRLDAATAVLTAATFNTVTAVDGTGQDRVVVNPNNWVVTAQKPAAGTRVSRSQAITLTVVKPSDSSAGGTVNTAPCQTWSARTYKHPRTPCRPLASTTSARRTALAEAGLS
jgi:PASTA domain